MTRMKLNGRKRARFAEGLFVRALYTPLPGIRVIANTWGAGVAVGNSIVTVGTGIKVAVPETDCVLVKGSCVPTKVGVWLNIVEEAVTVPRVFVGWKVADGFAGGEVRVGVPVGKAVRIAVTVGVAVIVGEVAGVDVTVPVAEVAVGVTCWVPSWVAVRVLVGVLVGVSVLVGVGEPGVALCGSLTS